jgi:hypothetical protein
MYTERLIFHISNIDYTLKTFYVKHEIFVGAFVYRKQYCQNYGFCKSEKILWKSVVEVRTFTSSIYVHVFVNEL